VIDELCTCDLVNPIVLMNNDEVEFSFLNHLKFNLDDNLFNCLYLIMML